MWLITPGPKNRVSTPMWGGKEVHLILGRVSKSRAHPFAFWRRSVPGGRVGNRHAFIGSCTNARIEDLRDAAHVVRGHKVAAHVRAMIVPGSTQVRDQAEAEGLAAIFIEAGFEWRQSGCSMCLAMNDDVLAPGDRCALIWISVSIAFTPRWAR